ncbi:MAG: leucine-rich repeat domain-containing protein, partial [Planctomycetota bacterium]
MNEKELLERIQRAAAENATSLRLSCEGLTSLPPEIGHLTNLTRLDLYGNRLTSVPAELAQLTELRALALGANQLTSVPAELAHLTELTALGLSANQLTSVPAELVHLSKLTALWLQNNQLTGVPAELAQLTNLTILDLRRNQLLCIPAELAQLAKLTRLNLEDNRLTSLPAEIGRLKNLRVLSLDNNRLDSLPSEIGQLTNLITLRVERNELTSAPVELGGLTKLERLDLGGNPLESPPLEVVAKGVDEIRNYLRQLGKEGKDHLYEAKLLIVGEAGAGKTSLAKKIEDADYRLRKDQGSTLGIDVIEWHFKMDGGQDFRVNIWDFGGQQIYHATHQFFMTKRSLYALVADERKEDTDFDYWLNVVELLSDSSPVLIVQNEKQDRHREINEHALKGQFGNIKEILATNLATRRGLPEVCKEIRHCISGLPHVGTELPKTWVKVREALEKEERNYISLDEYLDICGKNGFAQEKDKLQLSGYLHDLGVCLHFQNDLLLRKTVILKPEWGTDAV